jgi:long-chain acyl-CoA synthetase
MESESLGDLILHTLQHRSDERALEYLGRWYSWSEVREAASAVTNLLDRARIGRGTPVGLVARNRPAHIASLLSLILSQRCAGMIYSAQSPESMAADISRANFGAIIADFEDWTPATKAAAREAGCFAIALGDDHPMSVRTMTDVGANSGKVRSTVADDIALYILSSGTTGPPKRIPIKSTTLAFSLLDGIRGAQQQNTGLADDAPYILHAPLGNITGVQYSLRGAVEGRPSVLMEKFAVNEWVENIRKYRPSLAFLPPAGLRMVFDADISPEALASIKTIRMGGAPLDPALQEQFEDRYGIPILVTYGATEFSGVIVAWTRDDHDRFGRSKRGSVGRARPGVRLRLIADASSDSEIGTLEALVPWVSDEWIRTTDLASIDEDGFVSLHGRTDQVINRGGFKITPSYIVDALLRHPVVTDAVVIGVKDARLGEVPVAAVELRSAAEPPTERELVEFARRTLLAYQIPSRIIVLDSLPRTPSLKVSIEKVKELIRAHL